MDWWTNIMPIDGADNDGDLAIHYQNQRRKVRASENGAGHSNINGPVDPDCVMLVRQRKSRIYFMRSFFDYPLSLSVDTLRRLGLLRAIRILSSYITSRFTQRKPEKTLEDFLVNRFGTELYLTFFKSYTEKVWGVPCNQISATWGAQRIKGLSLKKAVLHFIQKAFARKRNAADVRQKGAETSLIEQFLYPNLGLGNFGNM